MQVDPAPNTVNLEALQEFRYEIDHDKTAIVKILEGNAELFGTELALDVEYKLFGKGCIFSWQGCKLETSGDFEVQYVGRETPMQMVLNIHAALDDLRSQAAKTKSLGPRVLIAMKSSHLLFVDLDSNEGTVSLPGSVSAMVLARPLDAEAWFSASETFMTTTPIAYYYGYSTPLEKPKLYNKMVSNLANVVNQKLNDEKSPSGLIIDSPAQFCESFDQLIHAIDEFRVNVVIVIGQERLYSDLVRKYPNNEKTLLSLTKSGGVVSRDKSYRRKLQLLRMKHYFYGGIQDLTPFSRTVSFADIAVRRVEEATLAPSSALPLGHERKAQETKFIKVESGPILLHSILAVSVVPLPGQQGSETKLYSPEEESALLLDANISGFIYISDVDDTKRKLTILCPNPIDIPKTYLIMGTLKWLET